MRNMLIQDFALKIQDFFQFIHNSDDGKRSIIKINSSVSEDEIYKDFGKIYRKYKGINRQKFGNYFFQETEDLIDKLCDDFESTINN